MDLKKRTLVAVHALWAALRWLMVLLPMAAAVGSACAFF